MKLGSLNINNLKLGNNQVKKVFSGASLVWEIYLLDLYPNATVAYSLRKLKSTTTNVVRVRRSSDNSEQDFSANEITDGTLTSFCGVGDGFVTTWYDQSGNNRNVTQILATAQPNIVISGVLVIQGTKPSIFYNSSTKRLISDTFTIPQPLTTFSVVELNTILSLNQYYLGVDTGSLVALGKFATNWANFFGTGLIGTTSNTDNGLHTLIANTVDSTAYFNGSLNASGDLGVRSFNDIVINRDRWLGTIQEVIIYPSNQTTNRVAIETEINNYYSIY
jgi:hypothetical protein